LNDFESELNEYATSSLFITCKLQVIAGEVCGWRLTCESAATKISFHPDWHQRQVTATATCDQPAPTALSLSLLWLRAICCSSAASPDTRLTVPRQQCRAVSTALCRPRSLTARTDETYM